MLTFRTILRRVHFAAALISGAVVTFMALTGAMLVFEKPIERALHPELWRVEAGEGQASLDQVAAQIAVERPGDALRWVRFTTDGNAPVEFNTRQGFRVNMHPATGAILGHYSRPETFFGKVLDLHHRLGSGNTGQRVVEASASVFVVSLLSGLWLWLPRHARAWRAALTLRRGLRGRARHFNLHNAVGAYAALALLAIALTGLAYSLFSAELVRYRGAAPAVGDATGPLIPLDRARDIALRQFPAARSVLITLPAGAGAPLGVFVVERDAPHALARARLFLHPQTGEVLAAKPFAEQGLGHKLLALAYPIHTGTLGGWPTQLLVFAAALAVPVLSVTGAALWWCRRRTAPKAAALSLASR